MHIIHRVMPSNHTVLITHTALLIVCCLLFGAACHGRCRGEMVVRCVVLTSSALIILVFLLCAGLCNYTSVSVVSWLTPEFHIGGPKPATIPLGVFFRKTSFSNFRNSLMFPADVPQYVSLLSIYHWRYSRVSTDGLPLTSLWCVHLFSPTGDENLLGHYKSISPDTSCSTDAGQTSAGGGDEDWESHAYWGTKLYLLRTVESSSNLPIL